MKSNIQYLLWANPKSIANSFEQEFYDENASLFNVKTSAFNENRSIFDIIKSCIVLQGLLNRQQLNKDYLQFPSLQLQREEIRLALQQQLPYIPFNGTRIFIPTYSVEINDLYYRRADVLKGEEYSRCLTDENYCVINPFLTYSFALLNSPFSRLIKLDSERENIKAYYHLEFETLFFVKEDLSLKDEFPIFDEKVKVRDSSHLFEKLNTVCEDYFNDKIEDMFHHMKELHLLSESLVDDCLYSQRKYQKKERK